MRIGSASSSTPSSACIASLFWMAIAITTLLAAPVHSNRVHGTNHATHPSSVRPEAWKLDAKTARAVQASYADTNFSKPAWRVPLLDKLVREGICFTGTGEEVRSKCKGDCCIGEGTCSTHSKDEIMTVCKGSCVGNHACAGVGPETVIFPNSCRGRGDELSSLCAREGSRHGVANKWHTYNIGPEACIGDTSCGEFDVRHVNIGHRACTGERACEGIAAAPPHKATTITIDNDACKGDYACHDVAMEANSDVTIGKRSCVGLEACYASDDLITVGDDSCSGIRACQSMQGQFALGKHSCKGDSSCSHLAAEDLTKVMIIGDSICVGGSACAEAVVRELPESKGPEVQIEVKKSASVGSGSSNQTIQQLVSTIGGCAFIFIAVVLAIKRSKFASQHGSVRYVHDSPFENPSSGSNAVELRQYARIGQDDQFPIPNGTLVA